LEQFHGILEASVTRYLSEKFNLPQIDITSGQIQRYFEEKGNAPLALAVAGLLEECNFARYAPARAERRQLEALFEQARQTIIQIEKEMGKK
jgi:hypothetical protein